MSDPVVVLDSGVLDRVVTDRTFRAVVRQLVEAEGWDVLVPTVVLAEAVTGTARDAPVNQFVRRVGTVDSTQVIARRAGSLRHATSHAGGRTPSGIDALVAAHAETSGAGVVFTTDTRDLRRLLEHAPGIRVEHP